MTPFFRRELAREKGSPLDSAPKAEVRGERTTLCSVKAPGRNLRWKTVAAAANVCESLEEVVGERSVRLHQGAPQFGAEGKQDSEPGNVSISCPLPTLPNLSLT